MKRALHILENMMTTGRQRVCEACGNEFTCGASFHGCWCSDIALTEQTRAELRARYKDCLCRNCLERVEGSLEVK